MSGGVVRPFDGTAAEWDAHAAAAPGFTHCHLHGWGDVLGGTFGHAVHRLAVRHPDGALAGTLQLLRVRGPLFGDFLVSLPYLNYGGPIGDAAAVQALTAAAVTQADGLGVDLLELRSRDPLPVSLPVSHRKVTVVLPLPEQADALFGQFEAKLRSQIRKPQKAGVEVTSGPGEVAAFFAVFAEHMRDLGTPVLPRSLFERVVATFGDSALVLVARLNGRPVAAGCGLFAGDEFEMIWASSLHAFSREAPNMLLYWRAMEAAMARGARRFNFGRCTVGAGTHRFKRQWTGSQDVPLHWYQHGRGASATPSPDDARYAWGPRLWRRLPLPVANVLGPMIIRGIP